MTIDPCRDCGLAHAGPCGTIWSHRARTTKAIIFDGESGPVKLYLHRAYDAGGNIVWVDITVAKEGSSLGGWARMLVRQITHAAAHGRTQLRAHLEEMRNQRFQPWGRTSLPAHPECSSIPDLVAQILLAESPQP